MTIDTKQLTIIRAAEHLAAKDFSAEELTAAYVHMAKEKNPNINAYLEIFDDAIMEARRADVRRAGGAPASVLLGIPLAIKDNILIKGKHASGASKILENYTATYDATVIAKLKDAGAVFVGRTNMDEFAMGGSTENSAFGPTKNPHDLTRVPGGSSGGSAAVVAMHGALGALGSDTGGSIRQPAAFCGVVGLKPTYGSVSRSGLMAMASSLDQIGPFAKTVGDAEILFEATKGHDPMDSTSVLSVGSRPKEEKKTLRIGVPEDFVSGEGIDEDVIQNFKRTLEGLKKAGHEIVPIKLSYIKHSLAVYYVIMPAEASSNLARYDGVRYGLRVEGAKLFDDYADTRGAGFGPEVRRRILLGTYVLSSGYYDAYYNKAIALRMLISQDFKNAFEDVDVIATPTSPTPAFKIGEKSNDPLQMYLADIFTVPVNLAGVPGISVPSGFVEREGSRLPLGIQFIAPHFREDLLFHAGRSVEEISESTILS